MTTFFTSDTHYGHDNVRRYSNRPYVSCEEMNEALITNHNAVVRPQDTVWFLGDFSFQKAPELLATLKRLNGHKQLILGNHDKILRSKPVAFLGRGLFESIDSYRRIDVEKQTIVLFHYGMRVWDKAHHGSWHLYGHSHGTLPPHNCSVDVGVDAAWITGAATYTPYSFEQIAEYMAGRGFIAVDHHVTR